MCSRSFIGAFRKNQRQDPLGVRSVLAVFPDQTWDSLDADFRRWASGLKR